MSYQPRIKCRVNSDWYPVILMDSGDYRLDTGLRQYGDRERDTPPPRYIRLRYDTRVLDCRVFDNKVIGYDYTLICANGDMVNILNLEGEEVYYKERKNCIETPDPLQRGIRFLLREGFKPSPTYPPSREAIQVDFNTEPRNFSCTYITGLLYIASKWSYNNG